MMTHGQLVEAACEQAEAAKENALRQLEHLRREIDYDYPPVQIRAARRSASRAVSGHIEAMEERARRVRRAARYGEDS